MDALTANKGLQLGQSGELNICTLGSLQRKVVQPSCP
jgi:hypothetical protein